MGAVVLPSSRFVIVIVRRLTLSLSVCYRYRVDQRDHPGVMCDTAHPGLPHRTPTVPRNQDEPPPPPATRSLETELELIAEMIDMLVGMVEPARFALLTVPARDLLARWREYRVGV